jgi:hypothetical protein
MAKVAHIIGNGKSSCLFNNRDIGLRMTCNLPPFAIDNAYATTIVDFKIMKAITDGSLDIPGEWILGMRPKIWLEKKPQFYMKIATKVKAFYTDLPSYAANHTDFNCGHVATHYVANKLKAEEIHLYGFDSLFSFDLTSTTDLFLLSQRDKQSTARLTGIWRPIWEGIFKEFSQKQFVFHHIDGAPKIKAGANVEFIKR